MKNQPIVGVACWVIRSDHLLLGKRKGSLGSGTWGTPGGHLESGELISQCGLRELLEETGLTGQYIEELDIIPSVNARGEETLTHFVRIEANKGTPKTLEPEKCEGWSWFPLEALPAPLFWTIPLLLNRKALEELL